MNVAFRSGVMGALKSSPRTFTRGIPHLLLAGLISLGGGLGIQAPASAQSASLRIDPPSQTVNPGQEFTIQIIQSADFATLGASGSLQFDPGILQAVSIEAGPAYADAIFLVGVAPQTPEEAIAEANSTGVLRNYGTLFIPGTGQVPPGETTIVTVRMRGRAGGTSPLNLIDQGPNTIGIVADPPDPQGNLIQASISGGEVTVPGGGGGGGAPTPTAAAITATPEVSASPSPRVARANASATMSVSTGTQEITVGEEGKVELKVKANVKISGGELDLTYDKDIIEVTKVEQGPSWRKATLVAGTGRQTMEQALADANSKGELKGVGVQLLTTGGTRSTPSPSASPGGPPAASGTPAATTDPSTATADASPSTSSPTKTPSASGQAGAGDSLVVLTVRGIKDGETELKLKNAEVLDENGEAIKVTAQDGKIVVGDGGGDGGGGVGLPLLILGGILGIGVVGGAGFAVRSLRRRGLGL